MKCAKCNSEWTTSRQLTHCPFCGADLFAAEAESTTELGPFLRLVVSRYGRDIYSQPNQLSNILLDLYRGEERYRTLYRQLITTDQLSSRVLTLSAAPAADRYAMAERLAADLAHTTFRDSALLFGIIGEMMQGLSLTLEEPVLSTVATEEDGRWMDEYGGVYSADGRKFIRLPMKFKGDYTVRNGVRVICDEAFEDCESLTEITLPDSVTTIGNGAFACSRIKNITLSDKSPLVVKDGLLYSKQGVLYWCNPDKSSVVIPSFITEIKGAFANCSSLTEITLPDSVTTIGSRAFQWCKGLTKITLPDGVTTIGDGTFYGCKSLKEITLPDSVTTIGGCAFCYCESLTEITLPDSVTTIGDDAFSGCSSLTEITLPDSVTTIGNEAFFGCESLREITLPDSVTAIGYGAF